MNYKVLISVPLLSIAVVSNSFCQKNDKKLMIRKGFESLDDKKDPAMASLTVPQSGSNSYLINAGISYALTKLKHLKDKSKKNSTLFSFVLNKNTMIKKEQNNFKLGVTWNYKVGRTDSIKSSYFMWSNTGAYARNTMDTTHSVYWTSYISMIRIKKSKKGEKTGVFVNAYKPFKSNSPWEYFLGWSFGPEYQQKFNSSSEKDIGGVFRAFYTTEFRVRKKIRDDIGDPIFDLILSNKGRYDLINNTKTKEGYLPLVKFELEYYPTKNTDFSIGFSYNTGSDPIAGLEQQDYYLLAMKFKK